MDDVQARFPDRDATDQLMGSEVYLEPSLPCMG